MPALPTIEYQSSVGPARRVASPSEFDHAIDLERGRWLRRRFLIFTGLGVLFAMPAFLPHDAFTFGDVPPEVASASKSLGSDFVALSMAAFLLAYVVAFVWAWRLRQPRFDRLLRAAVLLYVLGGAWTILFTQAYFGPLVEAGVAVGVTQASRERVEATTRAAATAPATGPTLAEGAPAARAAGPPMPRPTGRQLNIASNVATSLFMIAMLAFNHVFTCVLLPFRAGDSTRASVPVWTAATGVIAVGGVVWGVMPWLWAVLAFLLWLTLLPGTAICWWRHSRFNKNFRIRFESRAFRAMREELDGARRVHEASLPAPIADGPVRAEYCYEPMRAIGGDLLMLHRSPGGRAVTAVLFDVTGHGIAAALSVNRIVGEVERTFAEDPDAMPWHVLANLNRYVCATLARQQMYATAIVLRVDVTDAGEGTLTYVNGGHPPAVLLRPRASKAKPEVHELGSTAMMLGVCGGDDYDCDVLVEPFASGDAVVLYTDGASEAADPAGAMLGCPGVTRAVAAAAADVDDPAAWPEMLRAHVIGHRQAPPTDDTLLVAIWRP